MNIISTIANAFEAKPPSSSFLLAMSGGIDSCTLFDIMLKLDVNFAVAHAQFGLRGEESQKDEEFVRSLCLKNDIPYYTAKFDVPKHMEEHGYSLQMSARELRYQWFYNILNEKSIDFIITAHHLNDSMETFFINLLRGAGLRGLTGIKQIDQIFRPMLSVSLVEIESYAHENQILWREDESNAEDKYIRNKIRHHIIPNLQKVNPHFDARFLESIHHLNNDLNLIDDTIESLKKKLFTPKENCISISISGLTKLKNPSYFFYLFSPYGFNHPKEIRKLMYGNESAELRSNQYRLIKNRKELLLQEIAEKSLDIFKIYDLNDIDFPIILRFKKTLTRPKLKTSVLDFQKLKFPLSLRLRKKGDKFHPEGMGGRSKRVSKFFKDLKLSKLEKENTWILCNADEEIIGIPGIRWDERFIAHKHTTIWLQVEKLR